MENRGQDCVEINMLRSSAVFTALLSSFMVNVFLSVESAIDRRTKAE